MAKSFLGEATLYVNGTGYTLRPSFAALYAIEEATGLPLRQVTEEVSQNPPAGMLRCIFSELLNAAGNTMPIPDAALCAETAHALLEECLQHFSPDWPELYKIVTGILGRTEAEFREMTPAGFALICDGFAALHGLDMPQPSPLSQPELEALMRRFPDAGHIKP